MNEGWEGRGRKVVDQLERGVLSVSIDLELAWGFWDLGDREMFELARRLERTIITRILELFEKHDISATWATVGRLLKKEPGSPLPSPDEEAWYAPEVIEQIRKARPAQEIGSHSYAHIYFAEASAAEADADLDKARKVHDEHGLDFISFAFPRNMVGHVGILAAHGIKVYRSTTSAELLAGLGRVGRFADKFLPIAPKAVFPIIHDNAIVELPGSLLLMGRNGVRKLINPDTIVTKAGLGMKKAARTKSPFNFYFHPANFYFQPEVQFQVLDKILSLAAELRRNGEIDIWPMKNFASLLKAKR
jgi:hypothetical protein